jgi:NAD(P)-dependent dehydrogenase (short-subunit alcohol dehydrogenase family)
MDAQHGVKDRVIIVTGSGRGIGRGIAHHLGKNGAKVVVAEWKADRLDNVTKELAALGVDHLGVECDVAKKESIDAMVAATLARFGRVDGLVNNAQTFTTMHDLATLDSRDLDVHFNSGVRGTLWAMQAAYPHMKKQKWGRIVNVGSSNGLLGARETGAYNASKEAIRALTRTAAREWARDGITVNCFCPHSVAHRRPPTAAEPERYRVWQAMLEQIPMGRDGDAENDIAPPVLFLLSDACRYLTGQTLLLDGGNHMYA